MVRMMKARQDDELVRIGTSNANVDAIERGLHGDDDKRSVERRAAKPSVNSGTRISARVTTTSTEQPGTGQLIEGARGAVNGVERPKPVDTVEGAVTRIA